MKFTKMQGCGNDYVYFNGWEEDLKTPKALAVTVSDRHFGVGADGIVLILPSQVADCRMRMFNGKDGSESEMCGNAIRCVGKYVYEKKMMNKTELDVETLAGIKHLVLHLKENKVDFVTVDMGEPVLEAKQIPVVCDEGAVAKVNLSANGVEYPFTCVSMGNPHGVTFVDSIASFDVDGVGSQFEMDPHFPQRANIEFAHVLDAKHIQMRVWERGSGETLACGTGSCATLVAAVLNGLTDREAELQLLGGNLQIHWNEQDNHVYMTGPARTVFEGEWLETERGLA